MGRTGRQSPGNCPDFPGKAKKIKKSQNFLGMCRFVKDVLQIKEKRKGPVKGRASLKDGWENGCKPVHGRLAEL